MQLVLCVLLATVFAAPIRISCIGDSITAGVCSEKSHGYPALLQGLLGPNFLVQNFGNSGRTMLKNGLCGPPPGGDCSYWHTNTWADAQKSNPDIVTIMLGTNDAKNFNWNGQQKHGEYMNDFQEMISIMLALPSKPKVFVMVPPPLYPPDPYDMNKTVINEIFPVLLRNIARSSGAERLVIDTFTALGGSGLTLPQDFCDGCHPRDAGYEIIAQVIKKALV